METVYIVTAGKYSDYGIVAAFDNRAAAEAFCALGHGEYVEEYEVRADAGVEPMPRIAYRFLVEYPSRGAEFIREPVYILESDIDADRERIEKMGKHNHKYGWNVIDCKWHTERYVWLRENNPNKALKIVQDRIAKAKAEREGI